MADATWVVPFNVSFSTCTSTFSCPTDAIIGWEQNVTRGNENQTTLELCVSVANNETVKFSPEFEVSLAANTIRGTAAGKLHKILSNSELSMN